MLARLLFALVLALGAMPVSASPAPCHGDPGMAAMPAMPAHHQRHDPPAPTEHGCIGCATVADWLAERVTAPVMAPALAPQAALARLAPRSAAPPRERPPRLG